MIFYEESSLFKNGHDSNLSFVFYGVSQGSVLVTLLFSTYIYDLNEVPEFCKIRHFTDGTNSLHFNKSIAQLNKFD